jgi:EAL and modified HD-GYP domain-containing signal transduction protein
MAHLGRKRYFLGRQPILDQNQEIVGYELLFRAADHEAAEFIDHDVATASVISNALAGFGFRDVLGDKLGFINVNLELFYSELLEILPTDQTVLELLELIELDDRVMERCLELKEKGFKLALDDHLYSPEFAGMYRIIDIVKLDILEIPPGDLQRIATSLREFPVRLLAEKVETADQYETCLAMGFDLFQGYFFERPEVLKRQCLETSQLDMLRLLDSLTKEVEIDDIEHIFRQSTTLSYHLLTLVNSVNIGLREKIRSLRHAITILGVDKLRRWVQLALFATADSRGVNNPLLEMAAVRGRFMEYLIMERHRLPRGSDLVESAFMTGIFSLLDILFETSMEAIVAGLSLSDDVADALLKREGEMGALLSLAETLEQANFGEVQDLLEACGITIDEMMDAQLSAYNWRASVTA